jgi:cell migration-inducing and hyaluronan-binding protein
VIDSLFVGETDNAGNPTTDAEKAYGRSLPKAIADFPIRGYEYYDYRHEVVNSTFMNYEDNDTRAAGALSYLLFTSFGMHPENSARGLQFINAKPVHFPAMEERWNNDFGSSVAYTSATIHDLDGSISGVPDAYIVIDNGIASAGCEIKPSWGAAVCEGDIGRLHLGGNFGFTRAPIENPVMLSRNERQFEYRGETTIRSGEEIRVDTARESLSLSLRLMDDGSWIIFELPGFNTTAGGEEQSSLAALRGASDTSYFKDGDTLWVKLVVDASYKDGPVVERVGNHRAQVNLDVSR